MINLLSGKKKLTTYLNHLILFIFLFNCTLFVFVADAAVSSDGLYLYEASQLKDAGIIMGSNQGFELNRVPTRLEGLVVMIRLLGLEDEALKQEGETSVFSDVPDWGIAYVNYGFDMGFVKGINTTEFGSYDSLTANQFIAFFLRKLGYIQSDDLSIDTMQTILYDLGFINEKTFTQLQEDLFIRDLMVHLSYQFYHQHIAEQYRLFQQTNLFVHQVDGSDSNDGSYLSPFKSIQKAINTAGPGDIICIRGGTYYEQLVLDVSGSKDLPIIFYGKYGEDIIIDGIKETIQTSSGVSDSQVLFTPRSSYITMANIEIQNSPGSGLYLDRSNNNHFFDINAHDNNGNGIALRASNNTFTNCIASYNYDIEANGDNGDGFTIDEADGYGYDNAFYYCSAFYNSDDGYDTWGASGTIIKNSIAHNNGSRQGNRNRAFNDTNFSGNGNGFKLGIGIDSNSNSIVENCLAYDNAYAGFSSNGGGGNVVSHSTAYNNKGKGYDDRQFFVFEIDGNGDPNKVSNCVAYPNKAIITESNASIENSWNLSVNVNDDDFISLDENTPYFLGISQNSDLNNFPFSLGYTPKTAESFVLSLTDYID